MATEKILLYICKENPIDVNVVLLRFQEIWRYSNVTCAMYPLAPLDTIGPGGKPSKISKRIVKNISTEENLGTFKVIIFKGCVWGVRQTYSIAFTFSE